MCLTQARVNLQGFGGIPSLVGKSSLHFHFMSPHDSEKVHFPRVCPTLSIRKVFKLATSAEVERCIHKPPVGGGNSSLDGGDCKGRCPQKCCLCGFVLGIAQV